MNASGQIAVVPVSAGVRAALVAVLLVAVAGIAVAVGQIAVPWHGDTPQFLVLAGLNAFLALASASAFQHRWAVIRDDFDRQVRNVYLPIGLYFVLRFVIEVLPLSPAVLLEIDRISWTGSQVLAAGFLVFTLRRDVSGVGSRVARTFAALVLAALTGVVVMVLQYQGIAVPLQPVAVGLTVVYLIAAMMPLVGGQGNRLQREVLLGAAFLLTAGAHASMAWSRVMYDSPFMWGHILLAISLAVPIIGATHENVTLIVSEAKMARRVRRTRRRTELLLDTLPTLVLTVDSDYRLRYANRSAVALLELATRREDGPGRGWLQHFDAADRPALLTAVADLLEVGESADRSELVIRAVDRDGGLHWLQCQLYVVVDPVEDDPLVEIVGTDITDLTLARRTGEIRQNRLALLSNLAQTVAGEVAEERILGRIREALGKIVPVISLVLYRPLSDGSYLVAAASSTEDTEGEAGHPTKIEPSDHPCWRAFEAGFLVQTEVPSATAGESEDPARMIHLPLLAAGRVVGVLSMATDDRQELGTDELDLLTQTGILIGGSVYLSQLIRELEEQRAIAIEASRLKSEFLANTSHELRTPLTSILGFLRLIIDGAVADTDKQREFLEIAHESAEKLLTIINDVLDLAKIEAGRLEVHLAPTRITKVLADIEALFRHQMRSKGLRFEIEKPDTDLMLWADPNRTIQILTNLLSNSLKFTPRGGTVSVAVDGHDQVVTFFVRDSGIGISPEELGKVFSSFYQVDGSTTRHYGGTGLGLTISRRLASLMNGHLELTSAGRHHGVTAVLKLCEFTGEDSVSR